MCNNATVSPSTSPGGLADAVAASSSGSAARKSIQDRPTCETSKCCVSLIEKDGKHSATPANALRAFNYAGNKVRGGAEAFYAKITVNTHTPATDSASPGKGQIIITTLMTAVNQTAPTKIRPLSVALTDEVVASRCQQIPNGIARYWNDLPLKLDITDASCGRNIYDLVFDPQIVFSTKDRKVRGSHYKISIVNVPMQTGSEPFGPLIPPEYKVAEGQSYIEGGTDIGLFNIGEWRTVTDGTPPSRRIPQADILEAHEYAHMLGLKDEYYSKVNDFGGVDYVLPDGIKQRARAPGHLLDNQEKQTHARQARFAITVAYAVQSILNGKGRQVSQMKILGEML